MEFHKIIDVSYIGAMGPPGGGRQIVTNRFLRYFSFISFPELEDTSMTQIFDVILRTFVANYLTESLLDVVPKLIGAELSLYSTLLKELLPTPAKSHYTFNLRDIASVVQGVLSANTKETSESADLIRLWVHENLRVFRDRLVTLDDRAWFDSTLKAMVPQHFAMKWEDVVKVEMCATGIRTAGLASARAVPLLRPHV
jgi:dynein heavy chain